MSIQTIMNADPTGEQLVIFAKGAADRLFKAGLKKAQIRNIFSEVRQIEAMWSNNQAEAFRRLNMLKPKLYYQAARNREVKYLEEVLTEAIDEINKADKDKDQKFKRFVHLFEAILAYHRGK